MAANTQPEGRQAGAEIEVTPEMIEAGIAAYRRERPGEASDFNEDGVVSSVYLSMAKAR